MMYQVSIILPIYQVENYIENCINSIAKQTFKNFEVILVDDGSTDRSVDIAINSLERFKIKYSLIIQKNQGVSIARNIGIKHASGEYIVCVDPDDVLYRDFLKILYEDLIKSDSEVAIGNFQFVNTRNIFKIPKKIYKSYTIVSKDALDYFLFRKLKFIVPAMLIKKEFLFKYNIFYKEGVDFSEDQIYIWDILLNVKSVIYNNTQIYNYLIRPNSTMTSSNITKMFNGYINFKNYITSSNEIYIKEYTDLIISRWVFGVVRTSAKLLNFETFIIFYSKINAEKHYRNLNYFKDLRVQLYSRFPRNNLRIFYLFNKYI